MVAVQQSRVDATLSAYRTAGELLQRPAAPVVVALEAHARGAGGDTATVRRLYRQLASTTAGAEYVPPHFLALAALSAGADNEAVGWVERALDQRSGSLLYIPHEPAMDRLWPHEGLQRVMDRAI